MVHRRKALRLKGWDYTAAGYYFVTVCVKDKACILGVIANDTMQLNEWGKIVESCWLGLPDHYDMELDGFVIMPNHVHGIIAIHNDDEHAVGEGFKPSTTNGDERAAGERAGLKPAPVRAGLKPAPTKPKHGLSEIVRGFKTFSSRRINEMIGDQQRFAWQRSFHDHVVRDDADHARVLEYIHNNPMQWALDGENPKS